MKLIRYDKSLSKSRRSRKDYKKFKDDIRRKYTSESANLSSNVTVKAALKINSPEPTTPVSMNRTNRGISKSKKMMLYFLFRDYY